MAVEAAPAQPSRPRQRPTLIRRLSFLAAALCAGVGSLSAAEPVAAPLGPRAAETPPGADATPAAPTPRTDAGPQLLEALRSLNIADGFAASFSLHGNLRDDKLDMPWSATGDLTWRPDFVYRFRLKPQASAERAAEGFSNGTQRYLVFPDDGRYATRAMTHMDPTLTGVFAGTLGEHLLFNSLHRLALTLVPPADSKPQPGAIYLPPGDPIARIWGPCTISANSAGPRHQFTIALLPDQGDRLTVTIEGRTLTFAAVRTQQVKPADDPAASPAAKQVMPPIHWQYTETWKLADLPQPLAIPTWTVPQTADGKPFAEITLNAFGRDRQADRLVGQPAPPLVVDSYPPVYDIHFGPGLPGGWGSLPGIIAPRVVPGFAPLPTTGPQPIDWSEEPAKAAQIVSQPVTLTDLLKRYPDREVAVVFVALWSSAGQAALKDLAAWQAHDAPILILCNENTQTFIDDLGRRALPVSVCRDPQGRNGIRFGVDDYPMVYVIAPDRSVLAVQRGWAPADVTQLKQRLKLP